MKKATIVFVVLLAALLFPEYGHAQDTDLIKIAVLDLDMSGGVPDSYRRTLSDRLRQELLNTGRFNVIERNSMESVLSEQGFQLGDCTSDECVVQVGQLLGVERMIAGSIGKVGTVHTVSLRMIDVETGGIILARSVDCACPIEEVLMTRLRDVAYIMAGIEGTVPSGISVSPASGPAVEGKGDLYVKSEPPGASVYLDGKKQSGITPVVLEGISAGSHVLRLEKDLLNAIEEIDVQPEEMVRIEIELKGELPSVRIYSDPFEAEVYVDGKLIGKTPQYLKTLNKGEHLVVIRMDGYQPYQETIELDYGQIYRIDAQLEKSEPILSSTQDVEKLDGKFSLGPALVGLSVVLFMYLVR